MLTKIRICSRCKDDLCEPKQKFCPSCRTMAMMERRDSAQAVFYFGTGLVALSLVPLLWGTFFYLLVKIWEAL